MQAIRSILVVLDPSQMPSRSLSKARMIAEVTGARLHLLVHDKQDDQAILLSSLIDQLHEQGHEEVSSQQCTHGTLHEAIIEAQQGQGCDLVIKEHRPDSPLAKALLTPSDWKLLRLCPCAVLMVKHAMAWTGRVVLAAVDIGSTDEDHRCLHANIIDHAYGAARLAKGQLHVVTARPSAVLSAADPAYQVEINDDADYRQACRAFQLEHNIPDEHMHLGEGPADRVIPYVQQKYHAVLTVIGTLGRKGLSGALIGNTAEAVLDDLESDLLVLKSEKAIDELVDSVQI